MGQKIASFFARYICILKLKKLNMFRNFKCCVQERLKWQITILSNVWYIYAGEYSLFPLYLCIFYVFVLQILQHMLQYTSDSFWILQGFV